MTNETINKCIKQLRQIINDAEDEIKTLHHFLRDNSPIQPGDRVRITTPAHPATWNEVYGTIKRGDIIPEKDKGIAECVEIEINKMSTYNKETEEWEDEARPVYHPITKANVVAKVGRFTAGSNDIIEKI